MKTLATPHESVSKKPRQRVETLLLLLVALIMPAGLTLPAAARDAMGCDAREVLVRSLASDYAEQPAGLGVTNAGTMIELWQGEGGSTWSLVLTMPDGTSCIVGAGSDWVPVVPEEVGEIVLNKGNPRS